MIRAATILTAREWEPALATTLTTTGAARLVTRAYRPTDIESILNEIDVVVGGAETPWFSAPRIRYWRSSGVKIIGIHAAGDVPARQLLQAGHSDECLTETTPTDHLVEHVRLCGTRSRREDRRTIIRITGHCWPSERIDVVIAAARSSRGSVVIVEGHDSLPRVSSRLGTGSVPDAYQVAMTARLLGHVPAEMLPRVDGVAVCSSPGVRLPRRLEEDLITSLALSNDVVIVDGGTDVGGEPHSLHIHLVRPTVPYLMDAAVALASRTPSRMRLVVLGGLADGRDCEVRRWIDIPVAAVLEPASLDGLADVLAT